MTPQAWKGVLRAFGAGNLVIAALSVLLLLRSMQRWSVPFLGEPPPNFVEPLRWLVWSINVIFLGIFTVAGVDHLRLKLRAIHLLNTLFAAEAAFLAGYIFVTFAIGPSLVTAGVYLAASWLSSNFAIAAQLLSGYALVAVILLNLASKKLA